MVQLVNHTDVVSVEDLETLISEARHLASEEDAGTVHADLGGNLARTTGSGGEATARPPDRMTSSWDGPAGDGPRC